MMYISIGFTLLVLIAAMHLLIKVKKEGMGKYFQWGSYVVLAAATLMLLCELVCGICMMRCYDGKGGMGRCGYGMYRGGMRCHDGGAMEKGCCREMNCCDGAGMKCEDGTGKCEDGKMKCDKDTTSACCKDMKKDKDGKSEKETAPKK